MERLAEYRDMIQHLENRKNQKYTKQTAWKRIGTRGEMNEP